MRDWRGRLRAWDAGVRRLAEQAEARAAEADALIRDLYHAGRAEPWVFLGGMMAVRPYGPGCGPEDSGQATQAVLVVPGGLGVVVWDTEDLHLFPPGPDRWEAARHLFRPIATCRPHLRFQFLPFAAELVARLARHAGGR